MNLIEFVKNNLSHIHGLIVMKNFYIINYQNKNILIMI
jgi:hypothetical protein